MRLGCAQGHGAAAAVRALDPLHVGAEPVRPPMGEKRMEKHLEGKVGQRQDAPLRKHGVRSFFKSAAWQQRFCRALNCQEQKVALGRGLVPHLDHR